MSTPASQIPAANPDPTPLRFVTAASLFDGHDAAINIMRRLIQAQGAEVIHLGHNRSVEDVVRAALQEDADAIALSSYQGGHVEYFKYMVDMLRERGAAHIRVFGGGGGTITPEEIRELEAYGVERIYHPNDGMKMGLVEMIEDVVARAGAARDGRGHAATAADGEIAIGRALSAIEDGLHGEADLSRLRKQWQLAGGRTPVIGITGTGGAGKSSVTDELLNRFLSSFQAMRIAVISVDPTRRRSGGALLGDRIRMNSLRSHRVYMRSMATRRQNVATNAVLKDCIAYLRSLAFDLVIVETAGIGQSDSEIVDLVDFPMYVMTSDYGAASQLEKIDMLDYAELIVLNKCDRRGAEDALRDVRKQWKRNRVAFSMKDEDVPVYPTIASQFNDPGISWMFANLCRLLREKKGGQSHFSSDASSAIDPRERKSDSDPLSSPPRIDTSLKEPRATVLIPGARVRYLAEIAEQGRAINRRIESEAETASRAQSYWQALRDLEDPLLPEALALYPARALYAPAPVGAQLAGDPAAATRQGEGAPGSVGSPASWAHAGGADRSLLTLRQRYNDAVQSISSDALRQLRGWPARLKSITDEVTEYQVRGKAIRVENYRESLSHQKVPKIAAPIYRSWGELLEFLGKENLPGSYPYTGGVYPYRRTGEDPIRMFAGEGTPERTNRRFHYLSAGQPAARLSTAFDSVTLYGEDPAPRPDIYGKIGNSGVNIPTLDDMKKLYSGFDLCAPTTSVSMTINGPAPIILAMFMNTAVDQQVEKYLKADPGRWAQAQSRIDAFFAGRVRPRYHGDLPAGNDGLGLGLLAVARRLGQPVGYLPEHGGDVVQNISPTRRNADRQVSTSSKSMLEFHTEAAFHPHRPRYLLLLALRGDPSAATTLCSIAAVLDTLSPRSRAVLFQSRFTTGIDESYAGGRSSARSIQRPVLYGDPEFPKMWLDADLMQGTDPVAQEALDELARLVRENATAVTLEAGDLLVVDNDLAVHGRTPFTPRFDGTDRWLQRTFVVADHTAADGSRDGRVITTRFMLPLLAVLRLLPRLPHA